MLLTFAGHGGYILLTAYCLPILQKASVSEVAEAEADVS